MNRDQCTCGIVAKRFGKADLLLRRQPCGREVRSAEPIAKLLREQFNHSCAIAIGRLDDLHQRRPSPRLEPEKSTTKRRPRPALQRAGIVSPKPESARHCPLPRFRCRIEHKRIRGIEGNRPKQLHSRGPPVCGSSHDGMRNAVNKALRPTSVLPSWVTSKSPLSAMS